MKNKVVLGAILSTSLLASLAVAVHASDADDSYYYQPLYRLYNPNNGEHFYTSSGDELQSLDSRGWEFEGVGWISSTEGEDVYRLYNPNAGDHHYTLDRKERDQLVKLGWKYEGVSWKSQGDLPLYRLYNPHAKAAGSHHYTLSEDERDVLISLGWKYEGVSWHAIGESISAEEILENWDNEKFLEGVLVSRYVDGKKE